MFGDWRQNLSQSFRAAGLVKSRRRLSGWLFLGTGLLLVLVFWLTAKFSPSPVSFAGKPALTVVKDQLYPAHLKIASISLDLPVSQVELTASDWPLFTGSASYVLGSGIIGRPGNAIIYAHNRTNLFGRLKQVKNGDLVEITDQAGDKWHYQVSQVMTVSPKDIGVLSPTKSATLTLYTCTGYLDRQRLVIVSRL
ncbi:MAG TPA: sortase [Candidatus Bathyarchaeia archaeon]|nr:sortase [Candidatus Bathyarchaeia archaeon]